MSDFTLFLGKFLRHGTAIASVAPSSRWLSRATIANIDWGRAGVVVELGAGTGPITRELAARAGDQTRLVIVERDPDFAEILRQRYGGRPNLDVIEGDVVDLAQMLAERGIDRVDHVVSGLPTPSFSRELQQSLFRNVRDVLQPDGTYNQITEMPLVYWNFYRRFFDQVQFVFEPRNLPPAGAYICRGTKPPT
jgi:phosphatidylethanolamine/phosphatidyl-N-methylethanolamine N-methyltransferase